MKTPNFDFVGRNRTWLIVSVSLVLLSIVSLAFRGLNLSIDFVGGTSFVLDGITEEVTSADLAAAAAEAGATDVVAQVKLDGDVATGAIVRTAALELGSDEAVAVQEALTEVSGASQTDISFVGPSWGRRISQKALEALVVFMVVVVLYISVRLEFKMAMAAVLALVHDIFITIGLYSLAGFNVSPSTVIALLTILGYSLYDSVVVFDRVQETTGGIDAKRFTYSSLVNRSMNEVLWRSVNTSLTSLIPVGSLLFLGSRLLGADTLSDLALALFIGMALGAYSSLFVAGPFLAFWKSREPEHVETAARLQAKVGPEVASASGLSPDEHARSQAPVTTDYVRGRGKRKRRK